MNTTTLKRITLIPMLFTLFINVAMANTLSQPNVLWHNSTTGAIKFMPINSMIPENTLAVVDSSNTNLLPKGMGDFTGDGQPDILFHNQNSGNLRIWEMDGTAKGENIQVLGSSNTNLKIAGVGDFDGDGDNDIATFNTNSGSLRMWVMEGTTRVENVLVLSGANVNLVPRGAGDMDGDGIPDIVLRNNNSGAVRVWTMNSDLTRKGNEYVTGSSNTNLELRGVVDINNDGNNDILNYNTNTGKLRAWLMDGNLGITDNAEVIQDAALEWSVRGGYYAKSPDIVYFLEKDENNKIYIEKTVDGDLIVTEIENSKYKTRKFLLDGDDNVFEMEYQVDGVKLTYNGETEFININDTTQEQEIESQYIGIWRENVDEDWVGDIDIAYIYTDKAIVFIGNVGTGACSQTRTLSVSEFQSLLKNDIDVNDYVKATTYKEYIETSCGSYASLDATLMVTRLVKTIDTDKYDSQIVNTIDEFRKAPMTTLFGGTIAGRIAIGIFEWGKTKVKNASDKIDRLKHGIDSAMDGVKELVGIKAPAPVYEKVKSKVDNNDLSGLKGNIDNFSNYEKLNDGNSFDNETTFTYHKPKSEDDTSELQVTKVQAYDLDNKPVEEVVKYDENGEIVSITRRTYLGDDAFGAVYEEETICNTGYVENGGVCVKEIQTGEPLTVDDEYILTGEWSSTSGVIKFDVLANDKGNIGNITFAKSDNSRCYVAVSEDKKYVYYGGFGMTLYDTKGDEPSEFSFTYTVENLDTGGTIEGTATVKINFDTYISEPLRESGYRYVFPLSTGIHPTNGYNTLQANGELKIYYINGEGTTGLSGTVTYVNGVREGAYKAYDHDSWAGDSAVVSTCATEVGQFTNGEYTGIWNYYVASWSTGNATPCNISRSYNYETDKTTYYDYDGNVITY